MSRGRRWRRLGTARRAGCSRPRPAACRSCPTRGPVSTSSSNRARKSSSPNPRPTRWLRSRPQTPSSTRWRAARASGRWRSIPRRAAPKNWSPFSPRRKGDSMWGIIPAAGAGTRIQPLAFSKELLPVGSRFDGAVERPRAVSEHLIERMLAAGATKIAFIISPGKSDILEYYGGRIGQARICYLVQHQPAGLCDAIFQAAPFIAPDEPLIVGLPDTLWFPVDGLCALEGSSLSFLLFPVEHPELFDAVVTAAD